MEKINYRWECIKKNVYKQKRFLRKIRERFNINKCYGCGRIDCITEIHHIKPRCFGGKDEIDNVMPLCRDCHKSTFIKGVWTKKFITENQN